jgi:hypothetical protein
VEFISGKNIQNHNLPEEDTFNNFYYNNNSNSNTKTLNQGRSVNKINLNINKNININIIKNDNTKKGFKRGNSVSYAKNKINMENSKRSYSSASKKVKVKKHQRNFKYLSNEEDNSSISENLNYVINSSPSPKHIKQILRKQRKTITDLAYQYKSVKDTLSSIKQENIEKELIFNKNSEDCFKSECKIKENEQIIRELNEKLMKIEEEFDNYKGKSITDIENKEKKINELINKVSDLEHEIYKLTHLIKDKDKKKMLVMEKQIKDFTNEMQKLTIDNSKFKISIQKKDDEVKYLNEKISDLENKLVQSVKHKMNE